MRKLIKLDVLNAVLQQMQERAIKKALEGSVVIGTIADVTALYNSFVEPADKMRNEGIRRVLRGMRNRSPIKLNRQGVVTTKKL